MTIKNTFLPFVLGLVAYVSSAQCPNPQAFADLSSNNITARISNRGDLFTDGNNSQFAYQLATGKPSTIFASSLWMGGVDPAGNLKLAAVTYRSNTKTEYSAGPLDPDTGAPTLTDCANWDRVFTTTKAKIEDFKNNLPNFVNNPQAAIAAFPDIMGWPGRGNPHFSAVQNFLLPQNLALAPFLDVDGDAIYNPLQGDYPAVLLQGKIPFLPDQIIWCVFNDSGSAHSSSGGQPVRMEVQLTSWVFNTQTPSTLNNTVFTAHKFIYRGFEDLNDFKMGIWTDFDLGCYTDDYVGCNPDLNTFYAYNQDAVDGGANCLPGIQTFGEETPVQTVTFLNRKLDRFMYNNGQSSGSLATTDPNTPIEYYQYLNGQWRDGLPLTQGGNGYNPSSSISANYAFPDDPSDVNGWSMCTANLPSNDPRTLAVSNIDVLQPGAVNELTIAWTLHPDVPAPCNLGSTFDDVVAIQDIYDNDFQGISATRTPLITAHVRALPNPAHDGLVLDYGDLQVKTILCYDTQGRLIHRIQNPSSNNQYISTSNWLSGFYIAQLVTEQGITAVRFSVAQ